MIVPGQTVENPVTGERLTFRETARETGGEYVRFEALIAPGGTLASAHLHPYQSERFELFSGTLTMKVGSRTLISHEAAAAWRRARECKTTTA